jgi:hypothetical protein
VQATEDFAVHLFEDCNLCAIHAKRVTISKCMRWAVHITCAGLVPCFGLVATVGATPVRRRATVAVALQCRWTLQCMLQQESV